MTFNRHYVKYFNDIIINAAQQSLKISKIKQNNKPQIPRKKWYGPKLRQLKSEVKKIGKDMCRNPYNAQIRRKYYRLLKLYKRSCKSEQRKYKAKIFTMLGNLQSHNPKQYWKLVDELKDQPKNSNIDITKIFNHYKDLNNPEPKRK